MKDKFITSFNSHPNRDEILTKLLCDISIDDIYEWLNALYDNQPQLTISKKNIQNLKDNYLDFYTTIRSDLLALSSQSVNSEENVKLTIQNNSEYQKKLQSYLDNEVDIITSLKKMIAKVEWRADQLFEQMQEDPKNLKADKTIIEWLSLLLENCEKYQTIINGPTNQVNIQNNINIQVLDSHINMVISIFREVIEQLDYESSLLCTELFTQKLKALRDNTSIVMPQEERLEVVKDIENQLTP